MNEIKFTFEENSNETMEPSSINSSTSNIEELKTQSASSDLSFDNKSNSNLNENSNLDPNLKKNLNLNFDINTNKTQNAENEYTQTFQNEQEEIIIDSSDLKNIEMPAISFSFSDEPIQEKNLNFDTTQTRDQNITTSPEIKTYENSNSASAAVACNFNENFAANVIKEQSETQTYSPFIESEDSSLNVVADEENRQLKVRLDKWLWAARFFKTRALARAAVENHRVLYNGQPTNPSLEIEVKNIISIMFGKRNHKHLVIRGLSTRRRNANEANELYTETTNPFFLQPNQYGSGYQQQQTANHNPFRRKHKNQNFRGGQYFGDTGYTGSYNSRGGYNSDSGFNKYNSGYVQRNSNFHSGQAHGYSKGENNFANSFNPLNKGDYYQKNNNNPFTNNNYRGGYNGKHGFNRNKSFDNNSNSYQDRNSSYYNSGNSSYNKGNYNNRNYNSGYNNSHNNNYNSDSSNDYYNNHSLYKSNHGGNYAGNKNYNYGASNHYNKSNYDNGYSSGKGNNDNGYDQDPNQKRRGTRFLRGKKSADGNFNNDQTYNQQREKSFDKSSFSYDANSYEKEASSLYEDYYIDE